MSMFKQFYVHDIRSLHRTEQTERFHLLFVLFKCATLLTHILQMNALDLLVVQYYEVKKYLIVNAIQKSGAYSSLLFMTSVHTVYPKLLERCDVHQVYAIQSCSSVCEEVN